MESQTNTQGLMRFVPTMAKLKRVREVTRPSEFRVSGTRALGVIGLLVCIIGIQALVISQGPGKPAPQEAAQVTASAGAEAEPVQSRPEEPATAAVTGGLAETVGLFMLVFGLLVTLKPHILYYELKRLGLAAER